MTRSEYLRLDLSRLALLRIAVNMRSPRSAIEVLSHRRTTVKAILLLLVAMIELTKALDVGSSLRVRYSVYP